MLDRKEVEKLGNLAGLAPFVRIPSPAFEELLRVYRAWLDAPVGHVVGQSGPDGFFPHHSGAIVQMDEPASVKGKSIRLVRDGDSGEGESC